MFVLLDTNVWLASLTSDGYCRRVIAASAPLCIRVTTPYICDEIREKLIRKFAWTPSGADSTLEKLKGQTLLRSNVSEPAAPVRDMDDIPILAAAVAYGCQFLVTGDKDLLVLKQFSGVEIVTVREFATRLGLDVD